MAGDYHQRPKYCQSCGQSLEKSYGAYTQDMTELYSVLQRMTELEIRLENLEKEILVLKGR